MWEPDSTFRLGLEAAVLLLFCFTLLCYLGGPI